MGIRRHSLAPGAMLLGSLVVTAWTTARVDAQQFTDAFGSTLPLAFDNTYALAVADVDGDGHDDVFVGNRTDPDRLLRGTGELRLLAGLSTLPPDADDTGQAQFLDVDNDGDPDLVAGIGGSSFPQAERLRLYLNDGAGNFFDRSRFQLPTTTGGRFAAGDVDGDGDPDLVVGFANRIENQLLLNDGAGTFTVAASTRLPAAVSYITSATLVDVDGDLDLDAVLAGSPTTRVYVNDGTGTFTDGTPTAIASSFFANAVEAADLDRDGDVDLVFSPLVVLDNDGTGVFTDVTSSRFPPEAGGRPTVVDVDGDNDFDLVCARGPELLLGLRGQNQLFLNDGSGVFTNRTNRMPADNNVTIVVASLDADADGDADLIVGNRQDGPDRLYVNDGTGRFVDAGNPHVPPPGDLIRRFGFADVDGDDDVDVFVATSSPTGARNGLWINDGFGRFRDETPSRMPTDRQNTKAIATGDLDGDGDIDGVAANAQLNHALINDGTGVFQTVPIVAVPNAPVFANDVELVDVDADGDLDAVFAAAVFFGTKNRLFLNDGNANFTDATSILFPADPVGAADVAVADFDGDGDPDLMFAATVNSDGTRQWRNDGTGRFADVTAQTMPADGIGFRLAVADLDGDGDVDAVITASTGARVLVNDGSGTFTNTTATALPAGQLGTFLAADDFDLDGDVDIVLDDRLLTNDGSGTFTLVTDPVAPRLTPRQQALATFDLDGDGDGDLVAGHVAGDQPRVLWNLAVQTRLPFATRAGADLEITVFARNGVPRTSDLAVPILSAPSAIALPVPPVGNFYLDPTVAVRLNAFTLDPTTRSGVTRVPIPADPAVRGVEFAVQTVLVQPPTGAALTNAVRDRVLR